MKRNVLVITFCLMFVGLSSAVVFASSLEKRWGIGLGNPYVSIKYNASKRVAYEVRGAFGSGIGVYSVRFYRNFSWKNKTVTFVGLEGGLINFDKEDIGGDGSFGMLFLGFEHFISKKMTFLFDIGPAYINLSSEDTSVGGVEWVYNLGINFYFK